MASSHAFGLRLAARIAVLLSAAGAAAALLAFGRAPTAALLALIVAGSAGIGLWHVVSQGNRDLARFVTAIEHGDLAQSFRWAGRGANFDQLGSAYERALDRLRAERVGSASTAREAEALVDGAPTPLLVLGPSDEVRFANKAARRLFGRDDPAPLETLARFGPAFVSALRTAVAGPTRLSHLILDGVSQRVALDTTLAEIGGQTRRIVAIKVIQAELEQAELNAQIDLVRVLTHEVMNSLTPVTSLAETALRLVDGLDPTAAPGIADAQLAIGALARRAAELQRFVTSYKGFSEAPVLHRAPLPVANWFNQLGRLFAATAIARSLVTDWQVDDEVPPIDGDVALLTQVMLNLLKNAAEAAADAAAPAVTVTATRAGDALIRIVVADTGPGIPPKLMRDVFLPFFTTKPTGTGIGLSLARQIVMLHGGRISIVTSDHGHIELLLPTVR